MSEETDDTSRVIGGLGATAIVAGSMLGIGIFLAPPIVARNLPDIAPYFGIWVFAALAAVAGAVAMAELGAMMPQAGGDYVFQRRAFNPSVAFASGWVLFGAIFTGSVAALAVPICQYQLPTLMQPIVAAFGGPAEGWDWSAPLLVPWLNGTRLVAIALVLGFTLLNALNTKLSALAQTLMTLIPMAVLTAFAGYAVFLGAAPVVEAAPATETTIDAGSWARAYLPVYFAFAGWNAIVYVAGDVSSPSRNIPRSLIGGTVVVTLLYLLLCWAFLEVLGFGGLATSFEAGTASAAALGGVPAKLIITSLIGIALLASLNATVLQGGRVAYAMAKGGALWRGFASTNDSGVPGRALWFQAGWACLLILTGTFEEILELVSIAMLICGSLTVAALFVLRRREPDAERPYRALGYPLLPAFYLFSSAAVIALVAWETFGQDDLVARVFPLIGVGIMVLALVGHFVWTQFRSGDPGTGAPELSEPSKA